MSAGKDVRESSPARRKSVGPGTHGSVSDSRFFFIHIMKTAGGTLRQHIRANFDSGEVYPCDRLDSDMLTANTSLEYLTGLPAPRRAGIRVFTGHFPFVAVQLLGGNLTTITILRDPVERTISYLRQRQRNQGQHRGQSLEEIYEHPSLFASLIRDHQAKLFALTPEDRPASLGDVLDVDRDRLELAKENLERVDLVGIQSRFGDLLSELERRLGWRRAAPENRNVGQPMVQPVPASFRRRIAEDNQADMEFFEHAVQLCEQRRRTATAR